MPIHNAIRNTQYEILSSPTYSFSTSVEDSLQIAHFMQNKANFQNPKNNVTSYRKWDYDKNTTRTTRKNKPNQSQFQHKKNCLKAESLV